MSAGAIIVAAGSSTRMGGVDKLQVVVGGRPVLLHSVATFAAHEKVGPVVVVASASNIEWARKETEGYSKVRVVLGGARRRDSVLCGLDALENCEIVLVHDGARPLVTPELIDAAIEGAEEAGAALCAVPVADTVKRANASLRVSGTVSREGLWLAQTPQAFRVALLRRAHEATDEDATDDAALVEGLGEPVRIVTGSRENIKVTTAEDIALVEALLEARRGYTAI